MEIFFRKEQSPMFVIFKMIRKILLQAQIIEQISGPEISYYEKSILGCGLWSVLNCEIKGPNKNNFWVKKNV